MFIICIFSVTVLSLSWEYQKLLCVLQREIFPSFFKKNRNFLSVKVSLRLLIVASAIHVCQFSEARAPVVQIIVVLVAPAAGGVERA